MTKLAWMVRVAACGAVAAMGACGGGAAKSGQGGSSSATSSSGGAGGPSTTGSSSSSASSSSTTGSSSSSGGSTCQISFNKLHLQGQVDGSDVTSTLDVGNSLSLANKSAAWVSFGSGGLFYFGGGRAVLRMPSGGPLAGEFVEADAATFVGHTATLSSLHKLGTCPAASGTGSLSFCFDTSNACAGHVSSTTGTVNGTAFDWSMQYKNVGASDVDFDAEWSNGAAFYADHGGDQSGGGFTVGFLWMPSSGPDADALWCSGSGSFQSSLDTTQFDISGMTRLGAPSEAPAATGTIELCF